MWHVEGCDQRPKKASISSCLKQITFSQNNHRTERYSANGFEIFRALHRACRWKGCLRARLCLSNFLELGFEHVSLEAKNMPLFSQNFEKPFFAKMKPSKSYLYNLQNDRNKENSSFYLWKCFLISNNILKSFLIFV